MKTMKRKIAGVPVRFYKRAATASWTMDFRVPGCPDRIQESTKWETLPEAERIAEQRIGEIKGLILNLGPEAKIRGTFATAGEAIAVMDAADKCVSDDTLRTYKSALRRLARVVDEDAWEAVTLEKIYSRPLIERFFSMGQGREGRGVNWVDALEVNTGLMATVRNALALLSHQERLLPGLRLPEVSALKSMPRLKLPRAGFEPWPAGVFEAMVKAAELLKETEPELWLINVCLRRLGLRVEELECARRDWLEQDAAGRWCLVIKERAAWAILKHGKPRKLALDAELAEILTARTGYLIADGLPTTTRHDLICREHSQFLRRFIPDRTKSNHELRMHAASQVYTRHGLGAAAYFLGDSAATTERFYASWMGGAVGLDGDALVVPAVAA
jgi:hypothetical protein